MPRKPPVTIDSSILQKLMSWALIALATFLANVVSTGVSHIQAMGGSVEKLNANILVIVERLQQHKDTLDRHEGEIGELKRKKKD